MTGGGICGNHPCAPGEVYPPSTPSSGTGITVSTDKPSYNYGDTITISGTTSVYLGDTPLTLILRNPVGNIVIATQLTVGTDDTFSETAVATGALWQSAGTYTISAIYGNTNMSATTTFQFSGSSLLHQVQVLYQTLAQMLLFNNHHLLPPRNQRFPLGSKTSSSGMAGAASQTMN